ncbi:MAG TPA: aromatic amino acid transport family protein [Spirochaetales bacterium]|nr:aromatic amino acid transport family protein [Spirochaetales bacterium]
MSAKDKDLSFAEATSIIAGYGIGGGVLALPYLVSLNGLLPSAAVLVAAYCLSLLLHLMIAELSAGDGSGSQIVELFRKYLFTGKGGAALTWVFFAAMGAVFLANLAAYVAGGSEVLAAAGLPAPWGGLLFYAAAAAVAAFGLKVLGVAEKWAVGAMSLLFAVLVAASLVALGKGGAGAGAAEAAATAAAATAAAALKAPRLLALYGMAMFCFAAFFSVPQAVAGLAGRPKLVPKAVAAGLGVNFGLILVVTALSLLLSKEPTAIATVGWGRALGPWAEAAGTAFVILAMLTSYWSISFALSSMLKERLGLGNFPAWLLATAPTLLLALAGLGGFLDFMRTAGGAIAVLVAVLLVPAYRRYRKARAAAGQETPALLHPLFASPAWDWVAAVAYLLMAVGSSLPIK